MSFLPTTYNKIPTNSDYMKLKDGENNFRVLSSAIVGFEYWNTSNKPVRSRERWDNVPDDIKVEKDGTYKINHFWAFAVWNYDEKRVQLLEITQKQIMGQMKAYVDNPRWGDPKNYDITIVKSGTGFDTEYVVQANPPIGPADSKILEAYGRRPVNLEALYEGGDPFKASAVQQSEVPFITEEDIANAQPKSEPQDEVTVTVEDIPL